MLSISANGVNLDLPKNISIQIKKKNPMFSETKWEDGYSYSFTLPKTARNTSILYSKNQHKENLKIVVSYAGIEFVSGRMTKVKKKHDSISLNMIDEAMELRKKLDAIHFDSIELPSFTINDEADTPLQKQLNWKAHMEAVTFDQDPSEGSHKFPMIGTKSYSDWQQDTGEDYLHRLNSGLVNPHRGGEFVLTGTVPTSFEPAPTPYKQFVYTISPCIRIQYLLEKIVDQLGIGRIVSELLEIQEFKNMISFSGYCLDREEISGSLKFNTYGLGFDLNDFLPDAKIISLFNMISEIFGAFYIYERGVLQILLTKDILKSKPVDDSKYATPEYLNDQLELKGYLIKFEEVDGFQFISRKYSEVLPVDETDELLPNADISLHKKSDVDQQEVSISHYPLPSFLDYLKFWDDYNDLQTGGLSGWREFIGRFGFYNDFIRSDEFPQLSTERTTMFYPGVIRGIYPVQRRNYDSGNNVIDQDEINTLIQYSFNQLQIQDDTQASYLNYLYDFGKSSIYGSEEDNAFDEYQREFYDLLSKGVDIEKQLYLPPNKLKELLTWKKPKRRILQKNMSFQGLAKEASFTLSNNGISAVNVTYLVKSTEADTSFDGDYSNDFE